jgi:hypothetical protein
MRATQAQLKYRTNMVQQGVKRIRIRKGIMNARIKKAEVDIAPEMKGLKVFSTEYEKQLFLAVEKYPGEYAFKADVVFKVAERMCAAFKNKTYNKAGRAVKATCKALNIPWTYTAINRFLNEGV